MNIDTLMHNTDTSSNGYPLSPVPWTPRDVAWGLLAFVFWIGFLLLAGLIGENMTLPVDMSLFSQVIVFVSIYTMLDTICRTLLPKLFFVSFSHF